MICENCREETNPIQTNGYYVCPNCGLCISNLVFDNQREDFKEFKNVCETNSVKTIEYKTKKYSAMKTERVNFESEIAKMKEKFSFLPEIYIKKTMETIEQRRKNDKKMKTKSIYSVLLYVVDILDENREYMQKVCETYKKEFNLKRFYPTDIKKKIKRVKGWI